MKERIKSIVLTILIISNFILGSFVLSSKKLWSDSGYNFFSDTKIFSGINKKFDGLFNKKNNVTTHLEYPEMLVINTGYQTSRFSLDRSDSLFEELSLILNEYLKTAFLTPQKFIRISKNDFYQTLSSKSVYIRYPVTYDSSLFAYLLGATDTDSVQSFTAIKNIIVTHDGYVCIEDALTGHTYRCYTDISKSTLSEIINENIDTPNDTNQVINYAFDLGFDKAFGNQKALLSPIITLYSDELTVGTVSSQIPTTHLEHTPSDTVAEDILKVFNMNTNVFRRYTEADGTLVFVENNATLKISPKGDISYSANDNGVQLLPDALTNKYEILPKLAEFVNTVNRAANSVSSMQLSSNITQNDLSGDIITVTFDYLADGIPVMLTSPDCRNAVSVTVENGRISKYHHRVRSYTPTGENITVENYIYALDDSIARIEEQINDIEINTIDIVYKDDSLPGVKLPTWDVGIKEIIIDG